MVLLAACTPGAPDEPPLSSFTAGACRQAAPALISIDRLVHRVRDQHTKPQAVEAAMTAAQRGLRAVPPGADAAVDRSIRQLVSDVGLLRISLDTDNYRPARLDRVSRSQQATVKYCTRKGK